MLRHIDGLAERFTILNYSKYAQRFENLCTTFVSNALWDDHYETDIQWNILCFLFEISRNPIAGLRMNIKNINLTDDVISTVENNCPIKAIQSNYLIELLKADNIPESHHDETVQSSDSNLSVR